MSYESLSYCSIIIAGLSGLATVIFGFNQTLILICIISFGTAVGLTFKEENKNDA